ncbi:MAG: hypothetical protein B6D36_00380 [Planctomycetes bacterium UTPLA1]|nr:MAG: hypothetical protein B6D36_00380 [Planctomycetes bacterium UTPLA1]
MTQSENNSPRPNESILENIFEHFYGLKGEQDDGGAVGNHTETAVPRDKIERVHALCFDIDVSRFQDDFRPLLIDYLDLAAPWAELRRTSLAGNLHAIVRFKKPIEIDEAERIWRQLRKLFLSDPNASLTMKARVPGTLKAKNGERFLVQKIRSGEAIDADDLGIQTPDSECGESDKASRTPLGLLQFRALMKVLRAANGMPIWDGSSSHAICPIHGSGKSPGQCAIDFEAALCKCYSDCATDGRPKTIRLKDILQAKVLTEVAWKQICSASGEQILGGRPTVVHDSFRPLAKFHFDVFSELARTKCVFRYGESTVHIQDGRIRRIGTSSQLRGLVVSFFEVAYRHGKKRLRYTGLSKGKADALLEDQIASRTLPSIDLYTKCPVFDRDWCLVGPGYNPDCRIYYAGEEIIPSSGHPILDPLLSVFNWKSQADKANFVAILTTLMLPWHYRGKKPLFVFNGNRAGIGKTSLAKCCAALASDERVSTLTFKADDAEFEKTIASHVLSRNILIIDNARGRGGTVIESQVLERSITDERVSYRLLGKNQLIERDNDIVWIITANHARFCPDIISRTIAINLFFEGDPAKRISPIGDPYDYCVQNRKEILAELAGMIHAWVKDGRPTVNVPCRFGKWAAEIGGILACAGFKGFLQNVASSAQEFDPVIGDLRVLAQVSPGVFKKPADWLAAARHEGVLSEVFASTQNQRGQQTRMGQNLSAYIGQEIIAADDLGDVSINYELQKRGSRNGVEYGFIEKARSKKLERADRPSIRQDSTNNAEPANTIEARSAPGSAAEVPDSEEVRAAAEPEVPPEVASSLGSSIGMNETQSLGGLLGSAVPHSANESDQQPPLGVLHVLPSDVGNSLARDGSSGEPPRQSPTNAPSALEKLRTRLRTSQPERRDS